MAWNHLSSRLGLRYLDKLAVVVLCALMLAAFGSQYFGRLLSKNSVSEAAFATAPVEPKQQAFAKIVELRDPAKKTAIFAEDWWTYWAIKYLSLGRRPSLEVTILGAAWDRRFPKDFVLSDAQASNTQAFYVGYPQGDFAQKVVALRPGARRVDFQGYGQRVVLYLFADGVSR